MSIKWQLVNTWKGTKLFQVTDGKRTVNVEVETIRDRAKGFKRVCSSFGDFEVSNMKEVKESINKQFTI